MYGMSTITGLIHSYFGIFFHVFESEMCMWHPSSLCMISSVIKAIIM